MKLSGQPCERRQPLAPLGQRAFDQRGCELQPGERALRLAQIALEHDRGQPQVGELFAPLRRAVAQAPAQAFGQIVEPLRMRLQQRLALGEPVGARLQPFAPQLYRAQDRAFLARFEIGQHRGELGAHRHRHFRRGGRRWRAAIGGVVGQRGIGFMADRADRGDRALGNRAHHRFFVEAPQILDRPATPRDDDQIGPVGVFAGHLREPADRARDLLGSTLTLHQHRPHDHAAGEAVGKPVEDIADHRPGGRGDHADRSRQERQRLFALGREQAFRRQPRASLLEQREQRALARQLHPLDHDLVLGTAGIGRHLPAGDHFESVFGIERQALGIAAPHDPVDHRLFVLERTIHVARCRPLHPRQLPAQAHETEAVFHRPLQRLRNFAHAERLGVVARAALRYQARNFGI